MINKLPTESLVTGNCYLGINTVLNPTNFYWYKYLGAGLVSAGCISYKQAKKISNTAYYYADNGFYLVLDEGAVSQELKDNSPNDIISMIFGEKAKNELINKLVEEKKKGSGFKPVPITPKPQSFTIHDYILSVSTFNCTDVITSPPIKNPPIKPKPLDIEWIN